MSAPEMYNSFHDKYSNSEYLPSWTMFQAGRKRKRTFHKVFLLFLFTNVTPMSFDVAQLFYCEKSPITPPPPGLILCNLRKGNERNKNGALGCLELSSLCKAMHRCQKMSRYKPQLVKFITYAAVCWTPAPPFSIGFEGICWDGVRCDRRITTITAIDSV